MNLRRAWIAVPALALLAAGCVMVVHSKGAEAHSPLLAPAPVREARSVDAFRRVHAEGGVDVELRVGTARAVHVEGDAGRLAEVRTEVRGDTLLVTWHYDGARWRNGPRAVIDVEALDGVVHAGAGWMALSNLDQERLEVEQRGTGDVLLRGRVGLLVARISGPGDVDVAALEAAGIESEVSGRGRLRRGAGSER